MESYQFSVIVSESPRDEAAMLDMADALGAAGCLDATVGGHAEGTEIAFDREAASLQQAINSAVSAIEGVGLRVKRVEMQRAQIAVSS